MFGGILCLLGILFIAEQVIQHSIDLGFSRKSDTKAEETYNDHEDLARNLTLGQHNKSMAFMFGFATPDLPDFDPLNNPYVDIIPYVVSTGEVLTRSPDYDLRVCEQKDIDNLIKKSKQPWYTNPLCFKNRDKVKIKGNWFDESYQVPAVLIARCNPKVRTCADLAEINKFLDTYSFYFIHLQMMPLSTIYEDSKYIDRFPFFGDKKHYYPAVPKMMSKEFHTISYGEVNSKKFTSDEYMFSLNQFKLSDNPFDTGFGTRTEEFVKVHNMRSLQDMITNY